MRRMHASRNAQRLGNGFDRLRNSGPEWFTFMVCLKHVNEAEGLFLAPLVAAQVTCG